MRSALATDRLRCFFRFVANALHAPSYLPLRLSTRPAYPLTAVVGVLRPSLTLEFPFSTHCAIRGPPFRKTLIHHRKFKGKSRGSSVEFVGLVDVKLGVDMKDFNG